MKTTIGYQRNAMLKIQQPAQGLTAGQKMQAKVLGPTRHGVSVMIGREVFQLDVSAKLATAGTLTLQGSASSSGSGQQVWIVARDDRPLSKPLKAELTSSSPASAAGASTVVHKGRTSVVAQPIDDQGKALGPNVMLHLRTGSLQDAFDEATRPSSSRQGTSRTAVSDLPLPAPAVADKRADPFFSSPGNTHADAVQGPASGADMQRRKVSNEGAFKENTPSFSSSATAFVSTKLQHLLRNGVAGEVRPDGELSAPHKSNMLQAPSTDGEPFPIKTIAASAASTYRSGALQGPLAQSIHSSFRSQPGDAHAVPDRSEAITATVIARTNSGKVILKGAGQLLRIEQPVDLPLGTILQATLVQAGPVPATPTDPGKAGDQATLLAKLIALLDDIDQTGRQMMADQDQPTLARRLPIPDKHLASGFLGLLNAQSAQTSGSNQQSSSDGDDISIVQKDQIRALVRELGSMASEPLSEGWKGLTLPVDLDPAHAVNVYFRDYDFDPEDDTAEEDIERVDMQRAVFDVSFTQLGRCQIDALCQERRFDLLIRSENVFSPQDQQDIVAVFASACEIAGTNGEIGFHIGSFFEPPQSPAAARDLRT